MNIQAGSFKDFDSFKEVIKDWTLDFTILSKGDFSAFFKMFTSDTFLLSRERLNAKIEHSGVAPLGYRTFVIPVNYDMEFVWFNKKVLGKNLLVFPKNNLIDVVTYDGLDIHLLSIKDAVLEEYIEGMGYHNCARFFSEKSKEVFMTRTYSNQFYQLANRFLNQPCASSEMRQQEINQLIHFLLKYLDGNIMELHYSEQGRKDVALKKAIEIIHEEEDTLFSISQICQQVNVCERTLFNAFKDKYQVSPSDYFKAYRLNQVKKELNLSSGLKISKIAGKHHFWHMSQFAQDFKKQFGILPSEVNRK